MISEKLDVQMKRASFASYFVDRLHILSSTRTGASTIDSTSTPQHPERSLIYLGMILAVFGMVRLPTAWMAAGTQDEEWYGIPGLLVAQEGIPRVPYARPTSPSSVFFGADELLFAQPPLSFYAQAPFFLAFEGTYGTARLAPFFSALAAIVLVYFIGTTFFPNRRVALLGACAFSFSRLCFFPALSARPDMLCGALGLAAVACLARWQRTDRLGWISVASVCVGLAALTHPFAIVFGIQSVIWLLLTGASLKVRVKRLILFCMIVAATFSLWIPLILQRPDLFQSQFIGNILRPAGPGLLSRFVMPWESFENQIPQLIERARPIQFSLLAIGLLVTPLFAYRLRDRGARTCWALAASSVYLLVVCLGIHPIQGFWCYTAALTFLCVAYVIDILAKRCLSTGVSNTLGYAVIAAMILLAMVPGSGLRATLTHSAHWNEPEYSLPLFVRSILNDIPEGASITVGPEFSLDAYACGRQVILACRHPAYFDSTQYPTDFYLFGRRDFAEDFPTGCECEVVRSYGSLQSDFTQYATLYRRTDSQASLDK